MANIQELRQKLKMDALRSQLRAESVSAKPIESTEYKDEMPSWLETSDRAVVKNLSNNNEEALKYLQGKYPDAEFKASGDEIFARKRGESSFGKLDPSFSPFSNPLGTLKDLGQDVLDLGYDATQGIAEAGGATIGALGGGLAGALTGNPAGVALGLSAGGVAGAGAGAGAASTLKEALRKKYGLTDEMSLGDIATDATLGAVIPMAMSGAGKAIKMGAKKVAPSLYAKATGLSTGALNRIADKGDELANMDERGALTKLQELKGGVDNWVTGKKGDFAEKYKKIRGGSGDVSLSGVKQEFDDAIRIASEQYERTGVAAFKEQADQLVKMRDEVLGGSARDTVGISDAMDLDSRISNDWIDYADDVGQGVGTGRTVSDQQQTLAKKLRERLRGDVNQTSFGALQSTADEYTNFVDQINFLRKNFKDPKKIQTTLERIDKGKDIDLIGGFQGLDPKLIESIETAKGDIDLYRYFKPMNASILTEEGLKNFAVGKTPLEKLLTSVGLSAGYVSGGPIAGVLGGGAGRLTGKAITSPRSVKAVSKAGKKAGEKLDNIEKIIQENPWLMNAIYGGAYAGSVE